MTNAIFTGRTVAYSLSFYRGFSEVSRRRPLSIDLSSGRCLSKASALPVKLRLTPLIFGTSLLLADFLLYASIIHPGFLLFPWVNCSSFKYINSSLGAYIFLIVSYGILCYHCWSVDVYLCASICAMSSLALHCWEASPNWICCLQHCVLSCFPVIIIGLLKQLLDVYLCASVCVMFLPALACSALGSFSELKMLLAISCIVSCCIVDKSYNMGC
ncbi:uncharacterized protein BT62DRAFT_101296 [Guyanagaster necrorhizus]|uniref:Uncharacterized protein n=1 Tax=Guyanagaster necrorhizus TaxID=856835 RepID=A0A9P8ATC9_9AGAR|nr:uncharacterized protein BT62DRAFT_101296 [Guyanagaster necrorhizus MCA 3950]KAG7447065.1 hypothetical protein BT62DRAFT_101296 [Guyanagaster necrorhizus MCA 3950]